MWTLIQTIAMKIHDEQYSPFTGSSQAPFDQAQQSNRSKCEAFKLFALHNWDLCAFQLRTCFAPSFSVIFASRIHIFYGHVPASICQTLENIWHSYGNSAVVVFGLGSTGQTCRPMHLPTAAHLTLTVLLHFSNELAADCRTTCS